MKRDSFNVLFFIKKAKLLKNGEASVCMRITVNGARVENNIRKSIEPTLWNQAKECAKGKSRKSCDLNAYIENARIKLHQTFNELEEQGQFITARLLQEKFFGQDQAPEVVRTLIQAIQEHNDQCRELVGKDYALDTISIMYSFCCFFCYKKNNWRTRISFRISSTTCKHVIYKYFLYAWMMNKYRKPFPKTSTKDIKF